MREKLRILVVGGTGFVGRAIIEELQNAEKFELFCAARKISKISNLRTGNAVKVIQSDIAADSTLQTLEELENIRVLIHSAGLAHQFGKTSKADFWLTNVQGTENICRLAEKLRVRHLILISSVSVYGKHGAVEIDESFNCQPEGFYAESKLESERIAISLCEKSGIKLTILRLGTVIGEGDFGNVSRLITQVDKNRFLWIGKGENKKSLIYKKDVAKAVLRLLEAKKEIGIEIFNLTSESISMKEIVGAISENLKKNPLPLNISEKFIQGIFRLNKKSFSFKTLSKIEKTVEKWLSNDIFSGKNLWEQYGFKPQTPISEAISRQVVDYLEQKKIKSEFKSKV